MQAETVLNALILCPYCRDLLTIKLIEDETWILLCETCHSRGTLVTWERGEQGGT